MLQDKNIRSQINNFLMIMLKDFSEIKNLQIRNIKDKSGIENRFPPIYVDRQSYEGEQHIFNIDEIQVNEMTMLVFWCIKYQLSSKSFDIIKPIFLENDKKQILHLKTIEKLLRSNSLSKLKQKSSSLSPFFQLLHYIVQNP